MSELTENYTPEEKLMLIDKGLMDPKELGLAGADVEANPQFEVLPDAPKRAVFGTTLLFRAGAVPLELRALWAKQENKIIPFDEEAWKEEHKNEFPIQAELHCGNTLCKFGQSFQDPVLGLVAMLREAANKLETGYSNPDTVHHDPLEVIETESAPETQSPAAA